MLVSVVVVVGRLGPRVPATTAQNAHRHFVSLLFGVLGSAWRAGSERSGPQPVLRVERS